ncbi:MAG: hypothetical protein CSA20_04185 [Deltaproteobacteria bacterium]|nr:MAG: hypothetical protein CSA20_04185 [Deltaproteobacteria bacterium]
MGCPTCRGYGVVTENEAAHLRLTRARSSLLLRHPFFATLALRLRLQEDRSCHSAWTDGECLAYNPDYINSISQDKLVGLTAHIVMHPACGHHLRRGKRDGKRWNEACDYAINWILEDAGFSLPEAFQSRQEFREMSAEAIYAVLVGDDGEEEQEGEEPEEPENPSENDREDETGPQQAEPDSQGARPSQEGVPGEVRDSPTLEADSPQDGENSSWEEAMLSAASQAREMGRLPDGISRLVDKQLYPQLPWAELLARFIERNARSDYTWMMPNRRYLHQDVYFPALLENELQQIVVAVDTSGSVQPDELQHFAAEITAIMEQFPSRLHLLYCDAAVQEYRQFDKADLPVVIEPKGGGGTDFRPVFERVEKEHIPAACLIYLTDMECLHFPAEMPPYPVLWVQTGESRTRPPFGECIRM